MSGGVNVYRWRLWERRADTLLRKARELHDDMVARLGVESTETDFSDGAVEHMEYLADLLSRQVKARGALK